jgi:hypothetical protein
LRRHMPIKKVVPKKHKNSLMFFLIAVVVISIGTIVILDKSGKGRELDIFVAAPACSGKIKNGSMVTKNTCGPRNGLIKGPVSFKCDGENTNRTIGTASDCKDYNVWRNEANTYCRNRCENQEPLMSCGAPRECRTSCPSGWTALADGTTNCPTNKRCCVPPTIAQENQPCGGTNRISCSNDLYCDTSELSGPARTGVCRRIPTITFTRTPDMQIMGFGRDIALTLRSSEPGFYEFYYVKVDSNGNRINGATPTKINTGSCNRMQSCSAYISLPESGRYEIIGNVTLGNGYTVTNSSTPQDYGRYLRYSTTPMYVDLPRCGTATSYCRPDEIACDGNYARFGQQNCGTNWSCCDVRPER